MIMTSLMKSKSRAGFSSILTKFQTSPQHNLVVELFANIDEKYFDISFSIVVSLKTSSITSWSYAPRCEFLRKDFKDLRRWEWNKFIRIIVKWSLDFFEKFLTRQLAKQSRSENFFNFAKWFNLSLTTWNEIEGSLNFRISYFSGRV